MRTFLEFMEIKNIETACNQCFVEILEEAENNPAFKQLLIQEGFWDTLKSWGQGIGKFLGGSWQGVKTGAQVGWSAITGPATQMKTAYTALEKASAAIEKDPNWKQSTTSSGRKNLSQWLAEMIEELKKQEHQFQNKQLPGAKAAGPQSYVAGKGGNQMAPSDSY